MGMCWIELDRLIGVAQRHLEFAEKIAKCRALSVVLSHYIIVFSLWSDLDCECVEPLCGFRLLFFYRFLCLIDWSVH